MAENEFYKDKPSYYLLESFYFITEIISAVFVTRTVSSVKIQCNTRSMSVKDQKKKEKQKTNWIKMQESGQTQHWSPRDSGNAQICTLLLKLSF